MASVQTYDFQPPDQQQPVNVTVNPTYSSGSRGMDKETKVGASVCIGLVLFIFFVTFGAARVRVPPGDYALLRDTFDGTVDTTTVLSGPTNQYFTFQKEPLGFSKRIHFMDFVGGNRLSVTTNSTRGVQIDMMVLFQVPQEAIPQLYKQYKQDYVAEARKRIIEVVKNTAPQFGLESYLVERQKIEETYFAAVQIELAIIGLTMPDHGFHLRRFYLPSDVYNQYLTAAVQDEEAKTRQFEHEAFLIRLETEKLTEQIAVNATKIRRETDILTGNLKNEATATATKTLEGAEASGMKALFDTLGIANNPSLMEKALLYIKTIDGSIKPKVVTTATGANTPTILVNG
eukprot:GFYU01000452.1.p1 GENE.GFYU01000452.1~~GFYU01000452.1.p1  ORF type:complete len:345 (-),score=132.10 GFYU01000452.1:96-1130(-)